MNQVANFCSTGYSWIVIPIMFPVFGETSTCRSTSYLLLSVNVRSFNPSNFRCTCWLVRTAQQDCPEGGWLPSGPRGFGWSREAPVEARPPLPAHPGKARLRHHASQPANMHSAATPATIIPGQLRLPPRPTSCPESLRLCPASRCRLPKRAPPPRSGSEESHQRHSES